VIGLLAAGTLLLTNAAFAQRIETSGGQQIVGTGDTWTTWYAPTVVVSLDGQRSFLYVQGDEDLGISPQDQVFLFDRPNTWAALTSAVDLDSRIQILPNPPRGQGITCGATGLCFYGHPYVFSDSGRYLMFAHKSPDAINFNEMLLGCSNDGIDWYWRTLFTTQAGRNIPSATARYSKIGANHYFWGFVQSGYDVSPFRVRLSSHSALNCSNPSSWTSVLSSVEFQRTSGTWASVAIGGQLSNSVALKTSIGFEVEPKLLWMSDHWELWTSRGSTPNPHCGCDSGAGSNFEASIAYRTVTPSYSIGPRQTLYSYIRCLPASYPQSRAYPTIVEGTNLLYSMSQDLNCPQGNYPGAYIVVTGVQ